ncbi:uncharacterized protein FMAN_08113 [Fusarium mangiferae]|uniref:Uncharacterized protein n=1 Tax=Fusarium mangiferae TaxID=192010 RepID=A0A1L7TTQ5_FUSMA|nr:uncharacterized protein FMAN_08113 [Fusarium mangiferae]CVL01990.1 uncharacterized protein FMAN_08113 [Fusarium mangiferae]
MANRNERDNGEQQGESSKSAAAASQKDTQTTLDTVSHSFPTSSPPTITSAMQNHKRMVYHQLKANLVSTEDQERMVSEFFVSAPNASEQAAEARVSAFFGQAPDTRPRYVYHGTIRSEDNDDNIRALIRKGLRSERITDHDLREFVTERMVPLGDAGLTSSLAHIRIQKYLFECMVPFFYTIVGPDGSDPGPDATRIMAQRDTTGLVAFAKVAESNQPQKYLTVPKFIHATCGKSHAQKKAGHIPPVSGVPPEEKPDEGEHDKSPMSGEPSKTVDEGDGYRSPVGSEPSDETADEDDGQGSHASEAPQLDDMNDQNTDPTSCGSENRSDTNGELDFAAYEQTTLALYEAAVQRSSLVRQRSRNQQQLAALKITQCNELDQLHERKIEDMEVAIPED